MRSALAFSLIVCSLSLVGVGARAEDREAAGGTSIAYEHKGQFGIYSQFGVGYRAIFRYNTNDYCGTSGTSVCTGLAPPFIELGLSYAPLSNVELITDLRLG